MGYLPDGFVVVARVADQFPTLWTEMSGRKRELALRIYAVLDYAEPIWYRDRAHTLLCLISYDLLRLLTNPPV